MKIYAQTSLKTNNQFALQNNNFKSDLYIPKTENQDRFAKTVIKTKDFHFEQGEKYTRLISFCGGGNPAQLLRPAIQMKVSGVSHFQHNMRPELIKSKTIYPINELAASEWRDGDPLQYVISQTPRGTIIKLFSDTFGDFGRVPDEISTHLLPLLDNEPNNFKFELSNVIAGNTPGAATIGLRVNLKYAGDKAKKVGQAQTAFNQILTSSQAAEKVFQYQPPKSPKEIFREMLGQETKARGASAAFEMEQVTDNIAEIISNPEYKNQLYIGHIKTDIDATGSPLGMKHATEMAYPDKSVDCATGDDLLGIGDKLSGIDEAFKRPYSEERVNYLEKRIAEEQAKPNNEEAVKGLEKALTLAKDKSQLLDPEKKYDVVVLFDIATPQKLSTEFKKYIQQAKKVIFIDHHPSRLAEWEQAYSQTGVNMPKILKEKLALIADRVPAAAELAVIIASKLKSPRNPFFNPELALKTKEANPKLDAAVASFSAGMYTDTGNFSRTANFIPKDIIDANGHAVPVEQRPNFYPEGLAKWMFNLTHWRISKKWLRDNITYTLSDIPIRGQKTTARKLMLDYARQNSFWNKKQGLGIVTASYDEMQDVLKLDQIHNPKASIQNIQKEFMYSEVVGELKDPWLNLPKDQHGQHARDTIIAFVREEERKGELNSEWKISRENTLRFSFRSQDGTIYSELLASLFNGGGHGAAAGGHLKGKGITLNSKFSAVINGEKETDTKKIYAALMKNYKIRKNPNLSSSEQERLCSEIELINDEENGSTSTQIIEDMVKQIRENYEDDVLKDRNMRN